jgi:hypothetical protein
MFASADVGPTATGVSDAKGYEMGVKESRFCDFVRITGRKKEGCGKPVPNDEPTAVTVGTTRYLMDLCAEHQEGLDQALQPYVSVAHKAQRREGTNVREALQGKKGAFTTKDVRNWLKEQNREVPETGRLPNEVIREYQEAHQ